MSKSVCQFVVGLAVGIALVIIYGMLDSSMEDQGQPANSYLEKNISSIDKSLQGIRDELARMNEYRSLPSAAMVQDAAAEQGETVADDVHKVPVLPSRGEFRTSGLVRKVWIDAIDKSLAAALVEQGLTPYDPGISDLVTDAAAQLREAREETDRKNEITSQSGMSGLNPDYRDEYKVNEKEHAQKRKDVLASFRTTLAEYKRQNKQ